MARDITDTTGQAVRVVIRGRGAILKIKRRTVLSSGGQRPQSLEEGMTTTGERDGRGGSDQRAKNRRRWQWPGNTACLPSPPRRSRRRSSYSERSDRTGSSSHSTCTACARRSRRASSSTCSRTTPPTRPTGGCLKKVEGDPRYDKKKAQYLLKSFVELHPHAIGEKVKICVEHFAAGARRDRRQGQGDDRHALAPARRALQAGGGQVPGGAWASVQGARRLLGEGRGRGPGMHRNSDERFP